MDIKTLTDGIDEAVDDGLEWLSFHGAAVFSMIRAVLEGVYHTVAWALLQPTAVLVVAVVALLGWRSVGVKFALASTAGLAACYAMGLWTETMQTLALVLAATVLALLIAIPAGIVAGFNPMLNAALTPVLDMVQTLPPYIYLLPAIALLGFGPATALIATIIVSVPPALRLTAHGIRMTPVNFVELGQASGISPMQMFLKIRLPFALPNIMAGVNQCLMMAFGMVVIAGIVGSGGLGSTIYDAVRTLDISKSIDAGIAIVILTMILDRISEGAITKKQAAS